MHLYVRQACCQDNDMNVKQASPCEVQDMPRACKNIQDHSDDQKLVARFVQQLLAVQRQLATEAVEAGEGVQSENAKGKIIGIGICIPLFEHLLNARGCKEGSG